MTPSRRSEWASARRPGRRPSLQRRSSISNRIAYANSATTDEDDHKMSWIYATIGVVLVVVHSLAYLTAEYGMSSGKNQYSKYTNNKMCLSSLVDSTFDLLRTEDYHKWMDDTTTLDLAETGTYEGPEEIAEYAEFVFSDFFYTKRLALASKPILMADKECSVTFTAVNRYQIKAEYQPHETCLDTVVGYTLHYAPKPFHVKEIKLYYTSEYLELFFGSKGLDTDAVRDYVCGIMDKNCQETMKWNDITYETCLAKYDSLPPVSEQGYLDDNSKACRILHSAFAAINPGHCPHLSFIPQLDWKDRMKCQKSKGTKPQDLFSGFELDTIRNQGYQWGFDKTTLTKPCQYDPNAEQHEQDYPKTVSFAETVPLEGLNDYQFLVYVGFIMYGTMILSGLGGEYLVWRIVLAGEWTEAMEWKWKVAQFVFPILGATTVGLANTGSYLALPFLVVMMWKLGFPETTMLFFAALYQKNQSWKEKFFNFVIGMGTIVHHSSSALYVAMLVTHVLPSNRDVVAVTLPLVMQHWVVLLKYNHKRLYIVSEVVIEAWWEWCAFSVLPAVHELHWVGGVILFSMLYAHWCYFGGGIFAILFIREKDETTVGGIQAMFAVASRHLVISSQRNLNIVDSAQLVGEEADQENKDGFFGEDGCPQDVNSDATAKEGATEG